MDLEIFNTLYPWPVVAEPQPAALEWLWSYELEGRPEHLWPYLLDTSRMNRVVGYEASTFEERDGVLHGAYDVGSQTVEWAEPPWNWNYAQSMGNIRNFSSGLILTLRTIMHIEPLDDTHTQVWVYLGAVPRSERVAHMVQGYFTPRQEGYGEALRLIEAAAKKNTSPDAVYRPVPIELDITARERMHQIRMALYGQNLPQLLVDRLFDHLAGTDEFSLQRIQAIPLALRWNEPLDDVLRVMLNAVRQGLLTISWDLICPHCRGARSELATLAELPSQGYCTICRTLLDPTNEQALEVIFHLHPAIRVLPRRYFCLGDAYAKPHIKIHQRLNPGERRVILSALPPGTYRLRTLGEPRDGMLRIAPSGPRTLHWGAENPAADSITQANPMLHLINDTTQERVFILEEIGWPATALKPHQLFNHQEFRDLFSEETIATQLYIDVGIQTIMFCDVVRSTRFYAEEGDARAFLTMKQHFDEMRAVAAAHHGALIKTLGDGALLAFHSPQDGWNAAVAMQKSFLAAPEMLGLRIALHRGSCLAVTFHTGIDYFGQTVNIAAKLQHGAQAQQIALSEAIASVIQPELAASGYHNKMVDINHPSVPEQLSACVVTISGSDAVAEAVGSGG